MIAVLQIIRTLEDKMVTFKKSQGRTIVMDKKTGKPRAANKAPRTIAKAQRNKANRQAKAWAKAGRKTM